MFRKLRSEEGDQPDVDTGRPWKEDNLNLSKIQMICIFSESISSAAKMLENQLVLLNKEYQLRWLSVIFEWQKIPENIWLETFHILVDSSG